MALVTFEQYAKQFVEARRPSWKNAVHAAQWPATLASYAYPVIGSTPIADVSPSQVKEIMQPIWSSKPATAKKVAQCLWEEIGLYRQHNKIENTRTVARRNRKCLCST